MLVKNAPERVEADRLKLGVLRDLQLIVIEPPVTHLTMPRVTSRGDAVLRASPRAR